MQLITKANVGETIFYLHDSCVKDSTIHHIHIHASKYTATDLPNAKIEIYYSVDTGKISEEDIFLSREEMAKALAEGEL